VAATLCQAFGIRAGKQGSKILSSVLSKIGAFNASWLLQDSLDPSTTKIYHTSALPLLSSCNASRHLHAQLGHFEHVQMLNAAGKHHAHSMGWQVVDFENLSAQFYTASEYLRDKHHPAPWFLHEAFQIYLNIHAQQLGTWVKAANSDGEKKRKNCAFQRS